MSNARVYSDQTLFDEPTRAVMKVSIFLLFTFLLLFTYFGSLSYVWYKPASRATLAAPKPEAQPRAEGQVFTDPSKLCWQVHHS